MRTTLAGCLFFAGALVTISIGAGIGCHSQKVVDAMECPDPCCGGNPNIIDCAENPGLLCRPNNDVCSPNVFGCDNGTFFFDAATVPASCLESDATFTHDASEEGPNTTDAESTGVDAATNDDGAGDSAANDAGGGDSATNESDAGDASTDASGDAATSGDGATSGDAAGDAAADAGSVTACGDASCDASARD